MSKNQMMFQKVKDSLPEPNTEVLVRGFDPKWSADVWHYTFARFEKGVASQLWRDSQTHSVMVFAPLEWAYLPCIKVPKPKQPDGVQI